MFDVGVKHIQKANWNVEDESLILSFLGMKERYFKFTFFISFHHNYLYLIGP